MKSALKFVLAPIVLFIAVSVAYADTLTIASFGTGVTTAGVANTSLVNTVYDSASPVTSPSSPLTGTTYNLTLNSSSVWSGPIAGSYWVSADPNTIVGGYVEPNGYYTYTSQFSVATPGVYYGSIGTYADDTLELFINGVPIVPFANNSPNGPCAQGGGGPTCVGNPWMSSFTVNLSANNTITVVDWQSNGSAAGVDFQGTLSSVPEPGTMAMFGTGLISLVGALRRKLLL
jgi:hypothetical protein